MWSDQLHLTLDAPLSIAQNTRMKIYVSVVWSWKVWKVLLGLNDIALKREISFRDIYYRYRAVVNYEGESMMLGRRSSCFEFFNLIFVEIRSKE